MRNICWITLAFSLISIDDIHICGVRVITDATHYIKEQHWTGCISSKVVLRHLTSVARPSYFMDLMEIARRMGDRPLEGTAFEGYFQSLIWQKCPIRVRWRKYSSAEKDEMVEAKSVGITDAITCEKGSCAGTSVDDSVKPMKQWAKHKNKLDYWIPQTNLFETIDAVARWKLRAKGDTNDSKTLCLQAMNEEKHKCDSTVLKKIAQPFLDKGLAVCYMVIAADENIAKRFRFEHEAISDTLAE